MNKKFWLLLTFSSIAADSLASEFTATSMPQQNQTLVAKQNLQQSISHAITQFEQTPREDWSYRISRYENEEGEVTSSLELFDPAQEMSKQWTLLSINEQPPTTNQARKFTEDKQKQAEKSSQHNFSVKLREIIQMDSLELISEDLNSLKANFDVYLSRLGEDATKNLKGSLVFNKHQQFIESIEIVNTGDFSPVFSADITDFKLTFRFIKMDSSILPQQQELSMKGTFAFFTEIEEVSKDTFSEYRYVGQ